MIDPDHYFPPVSDDPLPPSTRRNGNVPIIAERLFGGCTLYRLYHLTPGRDRQPSDTYREPRH